MSKLCFDIFNKDGTVKSPEPNQSYLELDLHCLNKKKINFIHILIHGKYNTNTFTKKLLSFEVKLYNKLLKNKKIIVDLTYNKETNDTNVYIIENSEKAIENYNIYKDYKGKLRDYFKKKSLIDAGIINVLFKRILEDRSKRYCEGYVMLKYVSTYNFTDAIERRLSIQSTSPYGKIDYSRLHKAKYDYLKKDGKIETIEKKIMKYDSEVRKYIEKCKTGKI